MDGHLEPAWSAIATRLGKYTGRDGHWGGALCVYHRGEKVVDIWDGVKNTDGDEWSEDTLSMSFSTTKGVTATALHVLADRGMVHYDAPVATYWPEFAAAGKDQVTVRHLLTHQAGLHRVRGLVDDPGRLLDWDHMVDVLGATASEPPAGTRPGYHALTFGWLVGEIVRQVSGKSIGAFVDTELAQPLGLDGLYIGLPVDQLGRIAPLLPVPTPKQAVRASKVIALLERLGIARRLLEAMVVDGFDDLLHDPDHPLPLAELPAVSGMFDARSLARLYATIANDGELDGTRIFAPGRTAIIGSQQVDERDYCIGINMRWRLGYHQAFTVGRRAPHAFGHFGYGGSGAWADPSTQLAVAFVTNDLSGASTPFADARFARLGGIAQKIARSLS